MEIKVCGIRRIEDIKAVNKFLPDYIGFVFAPSKRQVSPEMAAKLSESLDKRIKKAGVFVNASKKEVEEAAHIAGLDAIQLHGDESEEYIASLDVGCEIWKAVRIKDGGAVEDVNGADKILLDKYSEKLYGGIGETFDWSANIKFNTDKPIILAGGLNKDNVLRGIEIFSPCCVDVSSSVETDGFKDEKKIEEFIQRVRRRV